MLQQATADLCWLLSRDYAAASALKPVGYRHQLPVRQRSAVERCACSTASRMRRESRRVGPERLAAQALWLDGYGVITTVEVALGGSLLLGACDRRYRDLTSMRSSYRKVAETMPALELLGQMTVA